MDDHLGQPFIAQLPKVSQEDESGDTSGEDDEGPDWTKLKSFALSSRPSLPKRGDKEFEPAINGATHLQTHSLHRARDAMFGALDAERGISKSVSYAVWHADLARAHVTQARGVLFNGMGHSVPRAVSKSPGVDGRVSRTQRRTELLPEETLYLIERGSLFCWKDEPGARPRGDAGAQEKAGEGEHDMRGSPMSVQQAFAEMIGRDDLTLEHYHAYAYLKRLGFNVIRAKPPSCFYPVPAPPAASTPPQPRRLLTRIFDPFMNIFARLRRWVLGKLDWWRPLKLGWLGCGRSYSSVFRALRIIPSGHTVPLHSTHSSLPATAPAPDAASSELPMPYEIFYHVYKPNTPFRKSAPPAPDYSLVVVNARTTPLPTIHELTYLWSLLPESGPPIPRVRHPIKAPRPKPPQPAPPGHAPPPPPSSASSLFTWLFRRTRSTATGRPPPPRKPHPFAVLKGGRKTVVVGVVDSGTVGFFRFGMGAFEELPVAVA